MVDATQKTDRRDRKDKAGWDPVGVRAGDLAEEPAGLRATAEVLDRAEASGLDQSINQPFFKLTQLKGGDPMPGFDRTGPMGAGPMTGGARGRCNPATAGTIPTYAGSYGYGRGLALRRGFRGGFGPGAGMQRGYGRGYGWHPPVAGPVYPADVADEMDMLKSEADYLKKSLDAINARIDALEKKPAAES